MSRDDKQLRQVQMTTTDFSTRDDGDLYIEGYFAVFNSDYHIAPGMTESVASGAFSNSLSGDIRALTNHDTTLVLGRTTVHTLELKEDSHGLWGRIKINPNDSDAMNTYERVKRGDVDQCSIGFLIRDEETEFYDDGSIHWTIKDVELFEVSVYTFPAYEETSVSARKKDASEVMKRKSEAWKLKMKERLFKKSSQEE